MLHINNYCTVNILQLIRDTKGVLSIERSSTYSNESILATRNTLRRILLVSHFQTTLTFRHRASSI